MGLEGYSLELSSESGQEATSAIISAFTQSLLYRQDVGSRES